MWFGGAGGTQGDSLSLSLSQSVSPSPSLSLSRLLSRSLNLLYNNVEGRLSCLCTMNTNPAPQVLFSKRSPPTPDSETFETTHHKSFKSTLIPKSYILNPSGEERSRAGEHVGSRRGQLGPAPNPSTPTSKHYRPEENANSRARRAKAREREPCILNPEPYTNRNPKPEV